MNSLNFFFIKGLILYSFVDDDKAVFACLEQIKLDATQALAI